MEIHARLHIGSIIIYLQMWRRYTLACILCYIFPDVTEIHARLLDHRPYYYIFARCDGDTRSPAYCAIYFQMWRRYTLAYWITDLIIIYLQMWRRYTLACILCYIFPDVTEIHARLLDHRPILTYLHIVLYISRCDGDTRSPTGSQTYPNIPCILCYIFPDVTEIHARLLDHRPYYAIYLQMWRRYTLACILCYIFPDVTEIHARLLDHRPYYYIFPDVTEIHARLHIVLYISRCDGDTRSPTGSQTLLLYICRCDGDTRSPAYCAIYFQMWRRYTLAYWITDLIIIYLQMWRRYTLACILCYIFPDVTEIHARLLDHRPILQGHINYFVKEFEVNHLE